MCKRISCGSSRRCSCRSREGGDGWVRRTSYSRALQRMCWRARCARPGSCGWTRTPRPVREKIARAGFAVRRAHALLKGKREVGFHLIALRVRGGVLENLVDPTDVANFGDDADSEGIDELRTRAAQISEGRLVGRRYNVVGATGHVAGRIG